MQDILDVALEQINDDKQDDRMRPITHECCTKTAEDDVYRNADGQEKLPVRARGLYIPAY